MTFRFSALLLVTLSVAWLGCGPLKDFDREIGEIQESIDRFIDVFKEQSEDWQGLIDDLAKEDIPEIIRKDLVYLAERAIGAASVEFRCDVDFIRTRVVQDFKQIREALPEILQARDLVRTGHICNPVPKEIDVVITKATPSVAFTGYDLDGDSIHAVIIRSSGKEIPIDGNRLTQNSHYQLILALHQAKWLGLPCDAVKIVIRDVDLDIGAVALVDRREPGDHLLDVVGGTGGLIHTAQVIPTGSRLKQVAVRTGEFVDRLDVVWLDPDGNMIRHAAGGTGGGERVLDLDEDEYITEVFGYFGGYIDGIGFRTDKRVFGPHGGVKSTAFSIKARPGFEIMNFETKHGSFVDRLWVYERSLCHRKQG